MADQVRYCPNCNASFVNKYHLGPHRRTCFRRPAPGDISFPDSSSSSSGSRSSTEPSSEEPDAVITAPVQIDVLSCARRPPRQAGEWGDEEAVEVDRRAGLCFLPELTQDYQEMQDDWWACVQGAHSCCCSSYWRLFKTIHDESIVVRDAVMAEARDIICESFTDVLPEKSRQIAKSWPKSVRNLRARVQRSCGNFWDSVVETHTIDLSSFGLATCKSVQFTFIDPIWVWIQRCNALSARGVQLHWSPRRIKRPGTDMAMYGGGVQYGILMHEAVKNIPTGGRVAFFNLCWDGGDTVYKARSAAPIVVQVMNCNESTVESVGLVAYLPRVEVSDAVRSTKKFANAQHHVLQVCKCAKMTRMCDIITTTRLTCVTSRLVCPCFLTDWKLEANMDSGVVSEMNMISSFFLGCRRWRWTHRSVSSTSD